MKWLCALLAAARLGAADLTGIWAGQVPGRNNEMFDIAFQFAQAGEKLTGKLYGDYRSTPMVEGRVSGEKLSFVLVVQEQAGNQINDTRYRYEGVLKDGELELTRERVASTNAGNGGDVQFRGNTKQTIKLKRL
ncbi:MAG: hypothetical protein FJW40_04690 [Acidobacteria bacterium]|nr:hypothetical protein [Acidobacteriota bacterium]